MVGREEVDMAVPVSSEVPRPGAGKGKKKEKKRKNTRTPGGGSNPWTQGTAPVGSVTEALRAWRLAEARRRAVAPFVILHDRTIDEICAILPQSAGELHEVPGIGPAKLAQYGAAILSIVASTVEPSKR
jgi:DNA topoisomerase-3